MTTTIIRAPRRQRFLVVDQRVVEDERLSWAARGVVCYLLSRPGNWKVLPRDLQKRGDLGRDGIYRVLRELLKVGYAEYHQIRDAPEWIRGADPGWRLHHPRSSAVATSGFAACGRTGCGATGSGQAGSFT